MRERLADWSYFVYLAHKPPTARVWTGLKSRRRPELGCGVQLLLSTFRESKRNRSLISRDLPLYV
jgi:hypothetical protein